jgi:hypothetical protein
MVAVMLFQYIFEKRTSLQSVTACTYSVAIMPASKLR